MEKIPILVDHNHLDGLQAQVDRLKALQAQTAAELEALLPSILDQAFKGGNCEASPSPRPSPAGRGSG